MPKKLKFDYDYWRKMTWDWYAIKMEQPKNIGRCRSKGIRGGLSFCPECEYVYSVQASGRIVELYKYRDLFKFGLSKKICRDCNGDKVKVTIY